MLAALEKQTRDSNRALELQREQYEYWLTMKTDDLKTLLAEFEHYKVDKTSQVNVLEKHCMHLFDYCNALATIMSNFDKGLYPVYEKTGIKAVQFNEKQKPGPMALDTIRDVLKFKKRADDFIKGHPTGLTSSFTEGNPSATSARSASGTGPTDKEEIKRLRDEADTLRSALAAAEKKAADSLAEVRAQVEQQVLSDLADHPTVEYIKRIEDERTYYKEQLHEEVRRCKDLRVALDAKQRTIEKSFGGSQLMGVTRGTSRRTGSGMSGVSGANPRFGNVSSDRFPAVHNRPQS